jgi:hypothetical protein
MFAYSCCILIPKSSSSSTGTYICIPGLKYLLIRLRSGTKLQHLVFRGSKSLPGPTRQRTHARPGKQGEPMFANFSLGSLSRAPNISDSSCTSRFLFSTPLLSPLHSICHRQSAFVVAPAVAISEPKRRRRPPE